MYHGVDAVGRERGVHDAGQRVDAELQQVGQPLADDVEREIKREEHHDEERRQGGILAREDAVDLHGARVLFALVALDHGGRHDALDERVAHVRKGRVAVEPGLVFHLHDAVLEQLQLVFIEFERRGEVVPAFDELGRAETRRHADAVGVVGDQVHDRVDAAVHGRIVRAEVRHLRQRPAARNGQRLVYQLGHALPFRRRDRHDGDAQRLAHLLHIDGAAVGVHLVHHVQRQHHRYAQLEQLQRQVQVALDIRGIHDVDDAVRLLMDDKIARDDLLLRIRTQGVNARQVDDGAALLVAHLAHLLIDGHAREVAHVLVGPGEGVEQRRLAAVLVADKRKDHADTPSTSIFFASSTRSVSS